MEEDHGAGVEGTPRAPYSNTACSTLADFFSCPKRAV